MHGKAFDLDLEMWLKFRSAETEMERRGWGPPNIGSITTKSAQPFPYQ